MYQWWWFLFQKGKINLVIFLRDIFKQNMGYSVSGIYLRHRHQPDQVVLWRLDHIEWMIYIDLVGPKVVGNQEIVTKRAK